MNEMEPLEDCAKRELLEETGLAVDCLVFLGLYDTPDRHQRQRTLTAAYFTTVDAATVRPEAGDDAEAAACHQLDALPVLAFDHARILADALKAWPSGCS